MSNVTTSPHRPQLITPDNHGGYVTITAALMMVWMVLFYFIRILVRYAFSNTFALDDIVITIGTVTGLVQSITVLTAVRAGLGRHLNTLSAGSLDHVELVTYAADLLFIVTITTAKIAASELIARLTRKKEHLLACRVVSTFIALWGVASLFTISIGCHPKHPWDMVDRCPNLATSWAALGALDVVLEIALIALPIYLVFPLQMSKKHKFIVTFAFGCRLPIIPLAILRLANLNNIVGSSDYTWDVVLATVYAQVAMHYSLISASIPCLRPFLKVWNTGYLATQVGQVDRTFVEQNKSDSYALRSKASTNYSSNRGSRSYRNSRRTSLPTRLEAEASTNFTPADSIEEAETAASHSPPSSPRKWKLLEELPVFDPFSSPTITSIQHPAQRGRPNERRKPELPPISRSLSTKSSSDKLVIHKTVGYTVTRSE